MAIPEIGHELKNLFGRSLTIFEVNSLIRVTSSEIWFEALVPNEYIEFFIRLYQDKVSEVIPLSEQLFDNQDAITWLDQFNLELVKLKHLSIVRFDKRSHTFDSFTEVSKSLMKEISEMFKYKFGDVVKFDFTDEGKWYFVDHVLLESGSPPVRWHTMLSHYLFSFVISNIVRYYPTYFEKKPESAFLSESWINQCPEVLLRYFVFETTPLRIKILNT